MEKEQNEMKMRQKKILERQDGYLNKNSRREQRHLGF